MSKEEGIHIGFEECYTWDILKYTIPKWHCLIFCLKKSSLAKEGNQNRRRKMQRRKMHQTM